MILRNLTTKSPSIRRPHLGSALILLSLLTVFGHLEGATISAKTASRADVGTAVSAAKEGDTVVVPSGTATWTTTLEITKNVTLQGAGQGVTVIIDEIPRGSQPPLINASTTSVGNFRLTGFTFKGGIVNTGTVSNGVIKIAGTCHATRVDHCTFTQLNGVSLAFYGFIWGVVDHCDFVTSGSHSIFVKHDAWNGASNGHGSWADDSNWGTERFVFIEDNTFQSISSGGDGIDSFQGARFVVRHNVLTNTRVVMHGSEGQGRGAKQLEEYENTFTGPIGNKAAGQIRSGSIISHDNTWVGFNNGHELQNFRNYNPSVHYGPVDGVNLWDKNAPNGSTGYWATGTHTGSNGSTTLTDSNANKKWWDASGNPKTGAWTSNRWVETGVSYMVRNVSGEKGGDTNNRVWATSNTANTVTCSTISFDGTNVTFNTGDAYEIWEVTQALDQPGLGKSDLLAGLGDYPTGTQPYGDPHQEAEPCYSWNNTLNLSSSEPSILSGRDFLNNTVKPGYTPYIYPHPLVSGKDPPPSPSPTPVAPQNLKISLGG